MGYPVWLYHPEKGALLVKSEAHEKSIGAGWLDTPAKFGTDPEVKAEPAKEIKKTAKRATA